MAINYDRILNIGIALSTKTDMNNLLDVILTEAMDVTNADAGTLYLYSDGLLHFRIMRNHTMNIYNDGVNDLTSLPPVPLVEENVCAYAAIHGKLVNIKDVYQSTEFDFSGPKRYDQITGYKTTSMLVLPLKNNRSELIGVLQLINALDENGNVVAFDEELNKICASLASLAAITVTNMKYTEDIKLLFESFVKVMSTAIDERTPYNARHNRNVATYTGMLVDYINSAYKNGETDICFSHKTREQLIMAAWLHDIGKLVTPASVMDKATRLSDKLCVVLTRFEMIDLLYRVKFLYDEHSEDKYSELRTRLDEAEQLVKRLNTAEFVSDEDTLLVDELRNLTYTDRKGEIKPWLTEEEADCLSIRRGTLTKVERRIMEEHVCMTEKLLSKIMFTPDYKNVALWASCHHERLNGKGYPSGLTAEQMCMEVRLLGVIDVFEALTSQDRPYKKPIPIEKSFAILDSMSKDGELDSNLVSLLKDSHIWEQPKIDS